MNLARWVQRGAMVGAGALLGAAAWPHAGAHAAAYPQAFTATSSAFGVQYYVDRNPAFSALSKPFDGAAPFATANLGGPGVSTAQANSFSAGGLEDIPALICTAAGSPAPGQPTYCSKIPPTDSFPPPFPFQANAQYPSHQYDTATVSASKPIGGNGAPLTVTPSRVYAKALVLSATGFAQGQSSVFDQGLISTGSALTTTTESTNAAGQAVSTAEATVTNVSIAKLINIGSIHSVASIAYDGTHKPKVSVSTTVSGVSVAGLAASIDQNGIHIGGTSNRQVLDILNQQLSAVLNADYITISVLTPTTTKQQNTVTTQAGGVLVNFDDTVNGAPRAPVISTIPFCNQLLGPKSPLNPILTNVPANLCEIPAPPDPNAEYFGSAQLGSVGNLVTAQSYNYNLSGGGGPPPPLLPPTTGTSTFVPGTAGTPGTPGTPGLGGNGNLPPTVANPPSGGGSGTHALLAENFGDVSKRLKYLFPALLLAVIGVLAGRAARAPARLPRAVS